MARTQLSVPRAVLAFALSGAVVLLLVGVVGVLVLRRVGTAQAMRQAEDLTGVAGRGILEPSLTDGVIRRDARSLQAVDALVHASVLHDPIVRVKLWAPDGTIVYSDEPLLINERFALGADELAALETDAVDAELSDLSEPENRFEREFGTLLEVYLPLHTPDGHALLFEAYLRFDSVAASGQQLWRAFLPVLAVALIALTLLQIPLAYWLARRVRDSQRDRERLLQRAIDASEIERRRIAGDLHDGPVQQLAGVSMSLSAAADRLGDSDPEARTEVLEAAARTRQAMRSLRSALMGIYPPTLQRAGLAAALADLAAPLNGDGVQFEVDVPSELHLPAGVEALLFRASQEAIRNVGSHARAHNVSLRVTLNGARVMLDIRDDGRGFSPGRERDARDEGHLGLRLLADLARDAGGTLDVTSAPDEGTAVHLEVPVR
jgi:two-component system, NarL family, sensor kinase